MPDIVRTAQRMVCSGLDLVHPIDRMPEGAFPYLFNARVIEEGRLEGRPGYSTYIQLTDVPNSIRRLNDPSEHFAPTGYIYVGGGGTNLYAGIPSAYAIVAGSFSGDPLSLIPFRPEQSPESWMYVYDKNKSAKVRPDGVVRAIGVAPPTTAPAIEYAEPAWVEVADGQTDAGWSPIGGGVTLNTATRPVSPTTIQSILYSVGTTGWACITPVSGSSLGWAGERMQIVLNAGGGNSEVVVVREIHPAIPATTIASVKYDSGTHGLCSIVLTNSPDSLQRNSLFVVDGETVRVLEVIVAPNGVDHSLRCMTTNTHLDGAAVVGALSWFTFTVQSHGNGETMTADWIGVASGTNGSGLSTTVALDLSKADGRPVDPVNDWLHVSLFLQNPQNVTDLKVMLCLDPTPTFDFANPGNCYIYTIPSTAMNTQGSSGNAWVDLVQTLGTGVRHGDDLSRTLANVTGVALFLTNTAACAWGFDWLYLFGTYGPEIQPSSPTGYIYASRFRDSSTGAKSVPSPVTRYELYPLREGVIITPQASNQAGVDQIDIYRQGGTITSLLYVGSVPNNSGAPNSYTDALPDIQVEATAQAPDLDVLQPWPIQQLPWQGVVNVVGTSVEWVSGDHFNTALLTATAITISGTTYQTFGQPSSTTRLQLTQDAGVQNNVPYEIASPTLAGQPLPFAFGALEGPFAPIVFALGDDINGGLLYFCNFSDADSASDANTLELAPPSSNLVSGAVWNGMAFAGNRDDIFAIRFSYLTQVGVTSSNSFQWARVPAPSGIWSRWACCSCPLGMAYLGRDGIYIATDTGAVNISDDKLYPMFPHDGQPAKTVAFGDSIIPPVDMTQVDFLRLTYCDQALRFSYIDIGGNWNTLIYEIPKKRWFLNHYADTISFHYLVEASESDPMSQEILALATNNNTVVIMGGDTDGTSDIHTIVLTAADDAKDERQQKLYVDLMVQADGNGTIEVAAAYDWAQAFSTPVNLNVSGPIAQNLVSNLSSLDDLTLHLNLATKYSWTGGPDGPRLYAWEASGFMQPYLSAVFVTQVNPFSFPGWKHMRRMWPAIISQGEVLMTIRTQDGRTYGPYTIPSTAGRYRQVPQILDAGIKDLAFGLQLDGQGLKFAFFPSDFVIELKEWTEESYIKLAVFRA